MNHLERTFIRAARLCSEKPITCCRALIIASYWKYNSAPDWFEIMRPIGKWRLYWYGSTRNKTAQRERVIALLLCAAMCKTKTK